jgi:hypothetical protein
MYKTGQMKATPEKVGQMKIKPKRVGQMEMTEQSKVPQFKSEFIQ